jgi:branched-chain amino acid transport system permease protein
MNTLIIKTTTTYHPHHPERWLAWGLFAAILIAVPLVLNVGASLSILSQMGAMMIFGLSYNMLFGQGGMLSFGHAVYSGLGAFVAIHAMNLASAGAIWIPTTLIPLVGGIAGMFFGVLFGYVTTKKSGTTFAMITLGIVELVYACSLMFPGFFGGESGISTNRVYGKPFFSISYGPQIEVYYLIAFWLFLSTIGMYAFTQTPLGRIINAVRDNPERVEFIGYDTQWARYLTLILSGFFAGIAGGLSAINFEIVTAENVSTASSGMVLLFTFIGGAGSFFGPMIGAVIGVLMTVVLSNFTKAWHLYLGLFFIIIVMYAPGGISGVILHQFKIYKHGKFRRILPSLLTVCLTALLAMAGMILLIEMTYHVALDAGNGATIKLFRVLIDTARPHGWIVAGVVILLGASGFVLGKRVLSRVLDDVNMEIEEQLRRGQA